MEQLEKGKKRTRGARAVNLTTSPGAMVPIKAQNLSPMYSRLKNLNRQQCADVNKQKTLHTAMVHMPIYNFKKHQLLNGLSRFLSRFFRLT